MPVEFETVKVRNVFKPRWWQLRFRYRLRRSRRKGDRIHRMLSDAGKKRVDEMEKEFERRIIYGDDPENHRG